MTTDQEKALRQQLVQAMRGDQSHVDFDSAVSDLTAKTAGTKPEGAPHTAWQLLEHLRIAQHDILEFSRNPKHKSPKWPDDYWPKEDFPANQQALGDAIAAFKKDAKEMDSLVSDPECDLFKPIEGGDGQTLLREALVLASHNSYHLGQIMYLKKTLSDANA